MKRPSLEELINLLQREFSGEYVVTVEWGSVYIKDTECSNTCYLALRDDWFTVEELLEFSEGMPSHYGEHYQNLRRLISKALDPYIKRKLIIEK